MLIQLNLAPSNTVSVPACFHRQKIRCYSRKQIPARDRVIDMGKYKGKMLGTLPSTYLKWVSNNLRAGDTEEWAKLADQVLADPIYRDRIEWEMAENILKGNTTSTSTSSSTSPNNAVSELMELSARFEWDYEDKQGWSRIDFGLLGTSKGGRIPRIPNPTNNINNTTNSRSKKENVIVKGEVEASGAGVRRRERRERMRRRRVEIEGDGGASEEIDQGIVTQRDEYDEKKVCSSPFPGRRSLFNNLRQHRRRPHSSAAAAAY